MSKERIGWYRVQVDKGTMKQLRTRSDAHGFLYAGTQLLTVCLTGWLCFYSYDHLPWWTTLAAFFLHGTFFSFLTPAAAGHELSHGTPFKTKAFNELFFHLFCFLTWTNPVWFRTSHARHHQNTLHSDIDQEVVLPMRYGPFTFLKSLAFSPMDIVNLLKKTMGYALGRISTDWDHRLFDEAPAARKSLFQWARIILIGHAAMIAAFLLIGHWILIPIAAMPLYCYLFSMLCTGTQHAGLQDNVPDFRRSCRTVLMNPFLRFWYWNMNYHIEHHMFAAVPFHALPRLHELMRHDCPVPCRGLIPAWQEILKTQRRQKHDPDHYFDNLTRT